VLPANTHWPLAGYRHLSLICDDKSNGDARGAWEFPETGEPERRGANLSANQIVRAVVSRVIF